MDESGGTEPYRAVETLEWTTAEEKTGKTVKLKGFAGATRLKLFRVAVTTHRTEYLVTNQMTQSDIGAAQKESGQRWKIEQFHREAKQTTVIDYRVFDPDRDGKTKLDHACGDARFDCAARHRVLERADGQLVCHDRLDEQTHQSRKTVLLSDKAQPASG